jgi:hypothetical protein
MIYSDHSPFWDNGYAALLAIETDFNPYYHQTSDTLDKLNPGFFTHVTRASLGLLAELAQPLREGYPRAPSYANVIQSPQLSQDPPAELAPIRRHGLQRLPVEPSHLDYLKLNTSPLPDIVLGRGHRLDKTSLRRLAVSRPSRAIAPSGHHRGGPGAQPAPDHSFCALRA